MAYIGSSASPLPVNFSAVQGQSFSGTGAQVAFTLNRSVASPVAIEVLVNNVQQSPYDGSFTVSGSTLTFSEAPSLGTNNIYVIYRDQSIGTLTDLTAYRKAEVDALLATKMPVNGPAFRAITTTAQTITNSTFTKVAFNIEEFDTNSNYDPTTNYRFTPTVAGYYQITANAALGGATVGYAQCYIYRNGFAHVGGSSVPNNNTVGGKVSASGVVYLNGSSDYVEFYVWQNQGASTNLQVGLGDNTFSGALIRSAT